MAATVRPENQPREPEITFDEYENILKKLGIDYRVLNQLNDKKQKAALKKILNSLQDVFIAIEEDDLSSYALINWAEFFVAAKENNKDLETILFPSMVRFWNWSAKKADTTMTWVYLGLNLFSFVMSLLALGSIRVDVPTATAVGSGWNYIDVLGGMATGIRQIYQGEIGMGVANLMSGAQLTTSTIIADVAQFGSGLHLAGATVSGLLGFSFAACMMISCGIEWYEARKCYARAESLKTELHQIETQLENKPDDPDLLRRQTAVQKAILIEQASYKNHVKSAQSWAACAVAMTAVAIISYLGLSTITFGALPLATILIGTVALISAVVRKWLINRTDYVEQLKSSMKENPRDIQIVEEADTSLLGRLETQIKRNTFNVDMTTKVVLPGKLVFSDKEISLKEYLYDLAECDPKKLEKLVVAMENNDQNSFESALRIHSNYKIMGGFGKTTGSAIWEKLHSDEHSGEDVPLRPSGRDNSRSS